MIIPMTSYIHSSLFIIIFCLLTGVTSISAYGQNCGAQSKEWSDIIALYNNGYDVIERIEKQSYEDIDENLWRQRKIIFSEAANKLSVYIQTCIKDTNSLLYLRNTFRLGTFWEISLNAKKAIAAYDICLRHPLITSRQSLFDEKPLREQVIARMNEATSNSRKRYSSKPKTIYISMGGGWAIHEFPDFESLPLRTKDFDYMPENSNFNMEEIFNLGDVLCLPS